MPRRNTSFSRNAASALGAGSGKPGSATKLPGVEARNDSVVAKVAVASRLPATASAAENTPARSASAAAISTAPMSRAVSMTPIRG
jgi:hypothetical protein